MQKPGEFFNVNENVEVVNYFFITLSIFFITNISVKAIAIAYIPSSSNHVAHCDTTYLFNPPTHFLSL